MNYDFDLVSALSSPSYSRIIISPLLSQHNFLRIFFFKNIQIFSCSFQICFSSAGIATFSYMRTSDCCLTARCANSTANAMLYDDDYDDNDDAGDGEVVS